MSLETSIGGARRGGGVATFITWETLAEHLRDAGQLRPNEEIESFVLEDRGFTLYRRTI